MESEVARLLLLASQPEERRIDAATLRDRFGELADVEERAVAAAVTALVAGEARAARAALQGHTGPLASAVALAAVALDLNWFPGDTGAIFRAGDIDQYPPAPAATGDATVDALLFAYAHVATMRRTWRSLATGFGRFGRLDRVDTDLAPAIEAARELSAAAGLPLLHTDLTLCLADVHHRAGDDETAARVWETARAAAVAAGDDAGVACCHLRRGDWRATPRSSPEVLGFDVEVLGPAAVPVDADAARDDYEQARTRFSAAGSRRGEAAVLVRLAHLDLGRGDHRRAALAAALSAAEAAGDTALALLARVHDGLATAAGGAAVDVAALAGAVAGWGERGSTSFHRGLVRLCLAQAAAWRSSEDVVAARGAMRLIGVLGAGDEADAVARELAELHRQFFPLAAVVLALGDLDAALAAAGTAELDMLTWMSLADRAMAVHAAAVDRTDPAAIAAAARRVGALVAATPTTVGEDTALGPMSERELRDTVRAALDGALGDAAVLQPLYEGTAARLAGRVEDAQRHFDAALAAARARGEGGRLLEVVVLGTTDRREEALPRAEALLATGTLAPDHAVALFVNLGAPQRAAELAAARPLTEDWRVLAEAAEIAERTGRPGEAVELAARATDRFERALVRFGRDALKNDATDDPVAAGLYLTMVRAELASSTLEGVGRAFAASDRCRSVALADLVGTPVEPAALPTIRAWRRAESRWAATFEELAEQIDQPAVAPPAAVAERLAAAETALDAAEEALARVAPDIAAARRQPTPPADVATIADALPPDTVLAQYHAYGDDLVIWALQHDGLRVARREVRWQGLASMARRFLAAAAGRPIGPADPEGLADLLLAPIAALLEGAARVVVVPYGGLTALPFHLLPFEGDALGARRIVSTLPAASLLPARRGRAGVAAGARSLVVGDPACAPSRRLRRLPGAGTEAHVVAGLLGGDTELLVGAAATESAVAAAAPGRSVLHLATHGLLSERSPNRSALALAGEDELTVGDLLGLDVAADLVVLSGCDTGRGTSTLGGDVIGLVRAVLAGGARDVVVSLWPVDDQAGCLLMAGFHERLQAGEDVALALATAAASVRALDGPARAAAYEAHRAAVGTEAAAQRTRDVGDDDDAPADVDTRFWAPFIHVGV